MSHVTDVMIQVDGPDAEMLVRTGTPPRLERHLHLNRLDADAAEDVRG